MYLQSFAFCILFCIHLNLQWDFWQPSPHTSASTIGRHISLQFNSFGASIHFISSLHIRCPKGKVATSVSLFVDVLLFVIVCITCSHTSWIMMIMMTISRRCWWWWSWCGPRTGQIKDRVFYYHNMPYMVSHGYGYMLCTYFFPL